MIFFQFKIYKLYTIIAMIVLQMDVLFNLIKRDVATSISSIFHLFELIKFDTLQCSKTIFSGTF